MAQNIIKSENNIHKSSEKDFEQSWESLENIDEKLLEAQKIASMKKKRKVIR